MAARKSSKLTVDREQPTQPAKCKGCVWGKWAGTTQVCGMPKCVKWWRSL